MKKYWKTGIVLLSIAACMAMVAGCGTPETASTTRTPGSQSDGSITSTVSSQPTGQVLQKQTATLSIGTKGSGFGEYPLEYEGELTPEILIKGMEDLTNWNLELAKPAVIDSDGIKICFTEDSTIFVGPPDPQKEEFHMFAADQLAETVLDSVQKTLQANLPNGSNLAVWYQMEDGSPLSLSNLEMTWPADQPYAWSLADHPNYE